VAHFARIDENNIVIDVLVVPNEQEHRGQEYLADELGFGGRWIQTSVNTIKGEHLQGGKPLRVNCAGIGFKYDEKRDAFIPPKPQRHPSWVLTDDTLEWVPPKPMPEDGKLYVWNEDAVEWVVARLAT
jgi:hypothetical protein